MVHFFRQFSTDHDQNMVNYRKIKAEILHQYSKQKSVASQSNLLTSRSSAQLRPPSIQAETKSSVTLPMMRSVSQINLRPPQETNPDTSRQTLPTTPITRTIDNTRRSELTKSQVSLRSLKTIDQTMDPHLKHKLQFEWRNIYRRLVQLQSPSLEQGLVSVPLFNSVCVKFGVILSHQEVAKLVSTKQGKINYQELSRDILNNKSTEMIGNLQVDKKELEKVFKSGTKKFKVSKKKQVLFLCQLSDKTKSG